MGNRMKNVTRHIAALLLLPMAGGKGAACWAAAARQVAADAPRVVVNGTPVPFYGQPPVEQEGRVLVPLRGVLERLGATVRYDPLARTVVAIRGETTIALLIGGREARVGQRVVTLDTPAQVRAGTTLVPLRFVAEALGAQVRYDVGTRTVAIDMDMAGVSGAPVAAAAPAPTAPVKPAASPTTFTGEFLEVERTEADHYLLKMTDGRTLAVKKDAPVLYNGQNVGMDYLWSGDQLTVSLDPQSGRGTRIVIADEGNTPRDG